ncbi:MAG: hypothetical protein P0S94_05545 [Simkaniaceae bacterium]|nr:hypothetical protein [Simkaniaceae bacterium]
MGVAKKTRFKDLVQNLWEGITPGAEKALISGGDALFQEGQRVFDLLEGVKVTPQYLLNIDDRYNAQIAKAQSIDDLFELEERLDTARLALECYLSAASAKKGKWISQKEAAQEAQKRFPPLFLGVELKLFQLAEAEMRSCGVKLKGVLSAKSDFDLAAPLKKSDALLNALCDFQSLTIGDHEITCLCGKQKRSEISEATEALFGALPKAQRDQALVALQHVLSKGALLNLVRRFADEFKSEKMVKIARHFSKKSELHVEPDASAGAIALQCDKKGKLHVVVSIEIVTSVPRDGGCEELARGIYEVELFLAPSKKKNGYELTQLTVVPSEQVV